MDCMSCIELKRDVGIQTASKSRDRSRDKFPSSTSSSFPTNSIKSIKNSKISNQTKSPVNVLNFNNSVLNSSQALPNIFSSSLNSVNHTSSNFSNNWDRILSHFFCRHFTRKLIVFRKNQLVAIKLYKRSSSARKSFEQKKQSYLVEENTKLRGALGSLFRLDSTQHRTSIKSDSVIATAGATTRLRNKIS
ncbi:hypothetical protein GEMRC1_007776 [Eukaryota sp. GEM-RC1]